MPKRSPHDLLQQAPKKAGGTPHINRVLRKITSRAMQRRGFRDNQLIAIWPTIVGAHLARFSQPVRLSRRWIGDKTPNRKSSRKETSQKTIQSDNATRATSATSAASTTGASGTTTASGATLIVKVEGAMALELQHLAPQIIERLNNYYGYAAIGKLHIIQSPVTTPASAPARKPLKKADIARLADNMGDITAPRLREALARLSLRLKQGR
ncbi:MAG: DciA family protein [Alphaproteobacteria bacterium]|nr:DciA family protein [Alphaproteobacteria bacterium]